MFLPGEIGHDLRLALSVAFSVGVATVGGLVVQLVIRLDGPVWVTLLALVTVVAAVGGPATARRDARQTQIGPRSGSRSSARFRCWGYSPQSRIGGWAIAIATEGAHRQASEARFSSLWLVPVGAPQTPQAARIGDQQPRGDGQPRMGSRSGRGLGSSGGGG